MSPAIGRRLAAWLAVASLLLAFPLSTSATVSGGCTAEGHASNSGSIDLTTEPIWHLRSDDVAGGSGTSTATMRSATISAYALGFAIPIANGTSSGDTSGSVDGVSLDTFSKLGKVFVVAGHATGDGACDGQVLIIIDDVDALFTVLGGGGLLIFILGLGAMLLVGRGGGCLKRIIALVFGGIAATGLALSLEQFQVISPTSPVGLVIVLVGAILGFLVAVRIGAPGLPAPGTPPPPTPSGDPDSGTGGLSKFDQMIAGGGGPTPDQVGHGAVDVLSGDTPPNAGGTPQSSGDAGPGVADVGQGAVDLLSGDGLGGTPPPSDPNAPGVDVGPPEPPTVGPVGPDGAPLT